MVRRGALGKLWGCHSPQSALEGHRVTGTTLWPTRSVQKRNTYQQSPKRAELANEQPLAQGDTNPVWTPLILWSPSLPVLGEASHRSPRSLQVPPGPPGPSRTPRSLQTPQVPPGPSRSPRSPKSLQVPRHCQLQLLARSAWPHPWPSWACSVPATLTSDPAHQQRAQSSETPTFP